LILAVKIGFGTINLKRLSKILWLQNSSKIKGTDKMTDSINNLSWAEFGRIDLRVGTVVAAEFFKEAIKPAIKLSIDFGADIGIKKSSAQITDHYDPEVLIGKQVAAVVNFPKKQIGPIMSECLVTGFVQDDGSIILAVPDKKAANGSRLA
jgi:tRNA-binding protein|tara:strand:- start:105 stop:557 length:453 start_codon:yes stop_codon:yes gene_type:complete